MMTKKLMYSFCNLLLSKGQLDTRKLGIIIDVMQNNSSSTPTCTMCYHPIRPFFILIDLWIFFLKVEGRRSEIYKIYN